MSYEISPKCMHVKFSNAFNSFFSDSIYLLLPEWISSCLKLSTENKWEKVSKKKRNRRVLSSVTNDQDDECDDSDAELDDILNGSGIDGDISKNKGKNLQLIYYQKMMLMTMRHVQAQVSWNCQLRTIGRSRANRKETEGCGFQWLNIRTMKKMIYAQIWTMLQILNDGGTDGEIFNNKETKLVPNELLKERRCRRWRWWRWWRWWGMRKHNLLFFMMII